MVKFMTAPDYITAQRWFEELVGPMNPDLISKEAIMYWEDGKPIACLSLFMWPPTLFMNWLISNPIAGPKLRDRALNALISFGEQVAIERGCKFSYFFATSEVLEKRFLKHNYTVTAKPCTELFKVLGG